MVTEIKTTQLKAQLMVIATIALGLNIVIELLGRSSLYGLLTHIFTQPIFFFNNILILSFTLSFSLFFRRKLLAQMIISTLWMAVGVANFVVLSYRITPFSAIDIFILNWNFSFMKLYANLAQILLCLCLLIVAIIGLVTTYRRCAITPRAIKAGLCTTLILLGTVVGLNQAFLALGLFESRISNMQSAYYQFGVVSCFTRSVVERGIDRPEEYSEAVVDEVLQEFPEEPPELSPTSVVTPNVIIVQLESFFDPNLLEDTTFSKNPTPIYTQLTQNYSSGALYVPVVGAGTANTEFEILTGMSVDFFGTGEYPYETILQERTCESVAYHLKNLGYHTTAMHNNTATFYQRNQVYPNLGFDTFVSSEFMTDISTTPQGWIKDECLTPEIAQTISSSDEPDFIFAVSVQGHGPFPKELDTALDIQVTSSPFEEPLATQLEYYVNQLYEMDQFVSELLATCQSIAEPTIVVLYGDHLPSLSLEEDDLTTKDSYQTSYVIWANFPLDVIDTDLYTYQLYSQLFDMMGLDQGILTRLHQSASLDVDYLEQLELLQYDMLYGEEFYADGQIPQPTAMVMGLQPVTLEQGVLDGDFIFFQGTQLTASSKIFVEDKELDTLLTEHGTLQVDAKEIQPGDSITVRQVSATGVQLSISPPLIWGE